MSTRHEQWESPEAALAAYRRHGDPDAVRALFDRTAPTLFRVALASAPDASAAEDLTQETYIAFLDGLDGFEVGRPVMPWLLGILRNRIRRAARDATRTPDPLRLPLREGGGAVPEEEADVARAAIEELDEPYRSVGLLHFVYGLQPAEIAHVRGDPPGTVRSQLHRARERLTHTLRGAPALWLLGHPVRPLSLIGDRVVTHASSLALPAAVVVGGAVVTKKILAAATVVALLAGGLALWFSEPPDAGPIDTTPAPITVVDVADGPVLESTPVPEAPPELAKAPDGPHVAGRVLDAKQAPIAGARLTALPSTIEMTRDPTDASLSSAVSDVRGRFYVPVGDDAPMFFLYVEAAGFAPQMAHVVRAGDEVVVTMSAATVLTGVVRDRDHKVVPGATVTLMAMIGGAQRTWSAVSDAHGAYQMEGCPALATTGPEGALLGTWLRTSAPGFATTTSRHVVTAGPGETQTQDVYVSRGIEIRGRVVLTGTETLVPNAHVVLAPSRHSRTQMIVAGRKIANAFETMAIASCRADEHGRFTFAHAPLVAGDLMMGGAPVIYAWGAGTCLGSGYPPHARDEAAADLTISVHPAAVVKGRLVDALGAPVGGVRVYVTTEGLRPAYGMDGRSDVPRAAGRTSPTGTFELRGVSTAAAEILTAKFVARAYVHFGAPVQIGAERDLQVKAGSVHDLGTIEYEIPPLPEDRHKATSRIRVVDPSGVPIWGASIGHSMTNWILRTDREGRTAISWHGSSKVTHVQMLARAPGYVTRHVDVVIDPKHETLVELRKDTATLAGTVRDEAGAPIAEAWIEAVPSSIPAAEAFPGGNRQFNTPKAVLGMAVSDAQGRFTVGDLEPGSYRLRVRKGLYTASLREVRLEDVEAPSTNLDVRLPGAPEQVPGVALEVTVVDAETGRNLLDVIGSLHSPGHNVRQRALQPGRLRFEHLRPGALTLKVVAQDYVEVTQEITIETDAPEPLVVKMTRGVHVHGRAVLPVAEAHRRLYAIWFHPVDGTFVRDNAYRPGVQPDGTYSTRGIRPGRYAVVAWSHVKRDGEPQYLVPRAGIHLDVPADGELRRDLTFVPGGLLQVRLGPLRPPLGGNAPARKVARFGKRATLELRDEAGDTVMRHESLHAGHAGHLGNIALLPGNYTLHLEDPDGTPREIAVAIEAGKANVIDLKR